MILTNKMEYHALRDAVLSSLQLFSGIFEQFESFLNSIEIQTKATIPKYQDIPPLFQVVMKWEDRRIVFTPPLESFSGAITDIVYRILKGTQVYN
jgi:hypothetical protein